MGKKRTDQELKKSTEQIETTQPGSSEQPVEEDTSSSAEFSPLLPGELLEPSTEEFEERRRRQTRPRARRSQAKGRRSAEREKDEEATANSRELFYRGEDGERLTIPDILPV